MNRPNASVLIMRDPALAARMGAISGDDFGTDDFGVDFGDDVLDDGMGVEFGADAAPAPAAVAMAAIPRPTTQQLHTLWMNHHAQRQADAKRNALLEPNKNAKVKIERYPFSLNQTLTLGTTVAINMSGAPDYNIRISRVSFNAPSVGFCTISEIKVANVSATSSSGSLDAFEFSPLAVRSELDLPTLTPANKASVLGSYTGYVPQGFAAPNTFPFTFTGKGWATIVA